MPARDTLKKAAKLGVRSAANILEFSAVMAKHGLTITDTLLGGVYNMANAMSPSIVKGTPIKDLAFKAAKGGLDRIIKLSKWAKSKVQ